jgi:uncharacterized protein with NRDE domain
MPPRPSPNSSLPRSQAGSSTPAMFSTSPARTPQQRPAEYRYISKLPMNNEWIWSYVKETTSHLQNKLTKNIHLGIATSTRPPFHESIS